MKVVSARTATFSLCLLALGIAARALSPSALFDSPFRTELTMLSSRFTQQGRHQWENPASFWEQWEDFHSRPIVPRISSEVQDLVTANFGIGPGVSDGRELFLHKWKKNDPLSGSGDGLGPVCNANACAACHFKSGIGGAGDVPAVMEQLELNTPALFGAGLIDRISNRSLKSNLPAKGKLRHIGPGKIGRFGWGAEFATLREFVATACAVELGLSNDLRKQDSPGRLNIDENAKPDLNAKQFDALVAYCRSLPRPRQVMPSNSSEALRVRNGEKVFKRVGCAKCHTPNLGGVAGIYSDFRLHELQANVNYSYGQSWKTPPLWGVADSAPYLHDGSAKTLEDAIAEHGGAASLSRSKYYLKEPNEQRDLIAFLKTLRAPAIAENCPPDLRGEVHISPGGLMCY